MNLARIFNMYFILLMQLIIFSCTHYTHVKISEHLSSTMPTITAETNGQVYKTRFSISTNKEFKRTRLESEYLSDSILGLQKTSAIEVDQLNESWDTGINAQVGLHPKLDLIVDLKDILLTGLQYQFFGANRVCSEVNNSCEGYKASIAYLFGSTNDYGVEAESRNNSGPDDNINGIEVNTKAQNHKVLLNFGKRLDLHNLVYLKGSFGSLVMRGSVRTAENKKASFDYEKTYATATVLGYQWQKGNRAHDVTYEDEHGNDLVMHENNEKFSYFFNIESGVEKFRWNHGSLTSFVGGAAFGLYFN